MQLAVRSYKQRSVQKLLCHRLKCHCEPYYGLPTRQSYFCLSLAWLEAECLLRGRLGSCVMSSRTCYHQRGSGSLLIKASLNPETGNGLN